MEKKYYTYALLDPLKPGKYSYLDNDGNEVSFSYEPFYIGKGTKNRILYHLNETKEWLKNKKNIFEISNLSKCNKIKKILLSNKEPIGIKLLESDDEEETFLYEKTLISIIGREDKGDGPLTNMLAGGDGPRDFIWTEELRYKAGSFNRGKKYSLKEWESIYGDKEQFAFFKLAKLPRILRMISKWGWREGLNKEKILRKNYGIKMKGRVFSEERKIQHSIILKGIPKRTRSKSHSKKLSLANTGKFVGEKNPMYGINLIQKWSKEVGEIKALEFENERRSKISKTTNNNKNNALKIFPNLKGNTLSLAYSYFLKGKSIEESEEKAINEINEKNKLGAEKTKEHHKVLFWKDIENGDIEKLKTLNDSKILLQIHSESIENELEEFRKRTGQKRATLSRINFLKDAINKNGITLETN